MLPCHLQPLPRMLQGHFSYVHLYLTVNIRTIKTIISYLWNLAKHSGEITDEIIIITNNLIKDQIISNKIATIINKILLVVVVVIVVVLVDEMVAIEMLSHLN